MVLVKATDSLFNFKSNKEFWVLSSLDHCVVPAQTHTKNYSFPWLYFFIIYLIFLYGPSDAAYSFSVGILPSRVSSFFSLQLSSKYQGQQLLMSPQNRKFYQHLSLYTKLPTKCQCFDMLDAPQYVQPQILFFYVQIILSL